MYRMELRPTPLPQIKHGKWEVNGKFSHENKYPLAFQHSVNLFPS